MKHTFPHDLEPELAKKAAEKAWEVYSKKFSDFSPSMDWVSPNQAAVGFSAKGIKLGGTLSIQPKAIEMELEVPFLLRPFKKKAIDAIGREIAAWVSKAKTGEV